MIVRRTLVSLAHAAGIACLLLAAFVLTFERWPAPFSLRPAKVVGLNPSEKEMGALEVLDGTGRHIVVSAAWERVEHLKAGERVWVRDFSDRYGDCTSEGTVLAGPIFLPEAALVGAFLYLGWLALTARRQWKDSESSSAI